MHPGGLQHLAVKHFFGPFLFNYKHGITHSNIKKNNNWFEACQEVLGSTVSMLSCCMAFI
jgi:hypothetical protein